MAYSDVFIKGSIGYNLAGWPVVVMERARSDQPKTPVLCEVWGVEHECGSVYRDELRLTQDLLTWQQRIRDRGFNPHERYFKGKLVTIYEQEG